MDKLRRQESRRRTRHIYANICYRLNNAIENVWWMDRVDGTRSFLVEIQLFLLDRSSTVLFYFFPPFLSRYTEFYEVVRLKLDDGSSFAFLRMEFSRLWRSTVVSFVRTANEGQTVIASELYIHSSDCFTIFCFSSASFVARDSPTVNLFLYGF